MTQPIEALEPITQSVLVVVPAYGSAHLTDTVVTDLLQCDALALPHFRIVVVDNMGDYRSAHDDERVTIHRPGSNTRWIGATNWGLTEALDRHDDIFVVINNDTRLSRDFLYWMALSITENTDIAIAAACYDDFWLHQRARVVPPTAADYVPREVDRDVLFCDGTAIAFAVPAVADLGGLDTVAFPRHGYGSDIDLALRVRAAGLRCVVTERAYVSHLRRATMNRTGESSEGNRAEILDGMAAKWGAGWREEVGLGPDSFPAHNTGSAATWYLHPPQW